MDMRLIHLLALTAAALTCTVALTAQLQQPAATPPKTNPPDHLLAPDFAQLGRYQAANHELSSPAPGESRVIFYGDSITDSWKLDQFFPGKAYINRGISGQTTLQMLVRLRQDVIDLQPKVLLLLAGTNDLFFNFGPLTVEQTEEDYASIAELARVHHITVVFSSVMPVSPYVHPDMTTERPPSKILELNAWLKNYCSANGLVYLDYFSSMVDSSGFLQKTLSTDGLHPNDAGYRVMTPLAQQAVIAALGTATAPSTQQ